MRHNIPMDEKTLKLVSAGLTDKRSKIKSAWAVAVSRMLWDFGLPEGSPPILSFSKSIAKCLANVFNDVTSNAIQASQNGTIVSGYAISAAALGPWLDWQDRQIGNIITLR